MLLCAKEERCVGVEGCVFEALKLPVPTPPSQLHFMGEAK